MSRRARIDPAVARLLALAAACAAAAAGLYLAAVGTRTGQRADEALRGGVGFEDSGLYSRGTELLNTVSVASLALLGALVMAIALARRLPRLAAGAGIVVLGANVTVQLLKPALERPRLTEAWWDAANSYPSGHATVGMSLAMALVLVAPPGLRPAAALAGAVYAVGIGVAVVALDWHRPSDVVGAYLVVTAWTAAVAAALQAWPDRRVRAADRGGGAWGVALAVVAAALVAIAAARTAGDPEPLRLAAERTRLVATGLLTAVAGAGLIAAVAALTRGRARGAGAASRRG